MFLFGFLLFYSVICGQSETQKTTSDTALFIIDVIEINGNKKTKEFVILNELGFSVGDSLTKSQIQKKLVSGRSNLLRTPLFHTVKTEARFDLLRCSIFVELTERWYLWPEFVISYADQNFSNWLRNGIFLRSGIGVGLQKYNFRGRNEKLSFFVMGGYDQVLTFDYNNIYMDPTGMHRLNLTFRYLHRKETVVNTLDNRSVYFKTEEGFALQDYAARIDYVYRISPVKYHTVNLSFRHREINRAIDSLNTDYLPGNGHKLQYISFRYELTYDTRNHRTYPEDGDLLRIAVQKTGLGLLSDGIGTADYLSLKYNRYRRLIKKITLINHFSGKISFGGKPAFYMSNGLGYSNQLGGYEYYTVHGRHYGFFQQRLSYALPKILINLTFIPWEQFNRIPLNIYLQYFWGSGLVYSDDSIYRHNNALANTPLFSAGIGINFVTYYDRLLRIEYSTNHLKEHGFFLHLEVPF